MIFFIEPGSTSVSARGVEVLEWFTRFFNDRRVATPQEVDRSCGPVPPGDWKVVVLAYADDPGTANQCALSLARGHAVRARLAALGIPESSIVVEAFGDGRKLVPTLAGENDVQNRRVELNIISGSLVEERSPYPRRREPARGACPE